MAEQATPAERPSTTAPATPATPAAITPLPAAFEVKVKDKANGSEFTVSVTRNSVIKNQKDAEDHVAKMPGSFGGQHPGFEVATPPAEPAVTESDVHHETAPAH